MSAVLTHPEIAPQTPDRLAGRPDSNLGMAESKSDKSRSKINVHSEKSWRGALFCINGLGSISERESLSPCLSPASTDDIQGRNRTTDTIIFGYLRRYR
jgi:hypothetical protein